MKLGLCLSLLQMKPVPFSSHVEAVKEAADDVNHAVVSLSFSRCLSDVEEALSAFQRASERLIEETNQEIARAPKTPFIDKEYYNDENL